MFVWQSIDALRESWLHELNKADQDRNRKMKFLTAWSDRFNASGEEQLRLTGEMRNTYGSKSALQADIRADSRGMTIYMTYLEGEIAGNEPWKIEYFGDKVPGTRYVKSSDGPRKPTIKAVIGQAEPAG